MNKLLEYIHYLTKSFGTPSHTFTDRAIDQLNIHLGANMGIEICRYQKFVVLELTCVKFL